jgi:hypothetical protein
MPEGSVILNSTMIDRGYNLPVFAPVTMTTLPVKSGISFVVKLDFGRKISERAEGT